MQINEIMIRFRIRLLCKQEEPFKFLFQIKFRLVPCKWDLMAAVFVAENYCMRIMRD